MALTFDQTLVLADDVLGNGQAEPGTVRAAADHWEKDGFLQFCRDAGAVVDDLARIREQHPRLPVIIMTAHSDLDSAVASYQGGAFEYLPKPFDVDEAVALVKRANQHAQEQQSQEAPPTLTRTPEIIGEAPAMQEVFRAIGRLSHSNITVLINGESGTGKERRWNKSSRNFPACTRVSRFWCVAAMIRTSTLTGVCPPVPR